MATATVSTLNSTPRFVYGGIKDRSVLPVPPVLKQVPQHAPLIYIYAEKGDSFPRLITGSDLTKLYGDKTIDKTGPFYNHATAFLQQILSQANSCFVKRIIPIDANVAKLTIKATIKTTTDQVPLIVRDELGFPVLDVNGNIQYQVDGSNATLYATGGASIQYSVVDTDTYLSGGVYNFASTKTGSDLLGWTINMPLITFLAQAEGLGGNNLGIRLWSANVDSIDPADSDVVNDLSAQIFQASLFRKVPNQTPMIIGDIDNETVQEFTMLESAVNYKTKFEMKIENLVERYGDQGITNGLTDSKSDLGTVYWHRDNLEEMLDVLLAAELANLPVGETETPTRYSLGILDANYYSGKPHYGIAITNNSVKFNSSNIFYLKGGLDGTTTLANFDTQVATELLSGRTTANWDFSDMAVWPISYLYDSGFSIDTKKAMIKNWLPFRKDVRISLGTRVVGDPLLNAAEEISVGSDLRSYAALYAENDFDGTPVCRVTLHAHAGKVYGHDTLGYLPMTFDVGVMRAKYMGASNGVLKHEYKYDQFANKIVQTMYDITNVQLGLGTRSRLWLNGINFVMYEDLQTIMHPAITTVYQTKNSVLVSDIFVHCTCDVVRKLERVWKRLLGNETMPDILLQKTSNDLILEFTNNKYDDSVRIEPNTVITKRDHALGFKWTTNVLVYGRVPKTVNSVNVIAMRESN